jgi:hypothetical protein
MSDDEFEARYRKLTGNPFDEVQISDYPASPVHAWSDAEEPPPESPIKAVSPWSLPPLPTSPMTSVPSSKPTLPPRLVLPRRSARVEQVGGEQVVGEHVASGQVAGEQTPAIFAKFSRSECSSRTFHFYESAKASRFAVGVPFSCEGLHYKRKGSREWVAIARFMHVSVKSKVFLCSSSPLCGVYNFFLEFLWKRSLRGNNSKRYRFWLHMSTWRFFFRI